MNRKKIVPEGLRKGKRRGGGLKKNWTQERKKREVKIEQECEMGGDPAEGNRSKESHLLTRKGRRA